MLGNADAPGGAVTFSGTSEDGSTVDVEVDGIVLGAAGAPGGAWTATFTVVGGPHVVRVRATDAAGNTGDWSGSSAFALDLAGPIAPVLDPIASPTGSALVTASGAAEAGSVVGVYVDGVLAGTTSAPTGAFSLDLTLAEGTRVLTAVAEDAGGNASPPSAPVTVVVDLTAPAAPVLDPLVTPTNALSVLLTGTAEEGSVVAVYRDGVLFGTAPATGGVFALVVPVPQGTHTFTAEATDGVGNISVRSDPLVILVDRLVPAAPTLDPLVTPTNAASLTVTGTTDAGTTVTVYLGGVAAGSAPESGGRFSLAVPVGDGTHVVTAVAADAASNPSAASNAVTVVVDQVAPAAPTLDPLVSPTNASSVTVTGTADAGSAVTVYRDGAPVATVVATGGTFGVTLPAFSGSVTFTATAADAAGNVSSASAGVTLVVDHAVPAAPVLDPLVTPTNATSVVVTGAADPGATVIVRAGGLAVGGAIAAGDGSFAVPVPVDEGTTTFTAVASDDAGNVSPPSNAVAVVADRTAPDAPLLAALDSPTGASTVTVAGTAEAGSAVTVYRDGVPAGVAVAGPSGAFALDVAVSDGTFTFTAEATDAAGNASLGSAGVTVVVDHALPAPPVLAALASPTNATTITVSGTAEAGATVTVYLDGALAGAAPAPGGTFALQLAVPEGDLAFTATSSDGAGNVSAQSATVFVTVDRTPPPAPAVASPVDGALLGAAAAPGGRVAFAGTAEPGATVELDVDGAATTVPAGTGAWSLDLALADGPHTVRARAVDAAGNAGPWTATLAFTADTAAPAAPSLDPLVTPTSAATVLVAGTAEAGATVTVLRDGAPAGTVLADGAGAFALPVAVGEGTSSFTATAADAAGNVSPPSPSVPVTVDRGVPAAPVLAAPASPTAAAAVVVTGTAEAGATVTVLRDGTVAGSGVAGAGGAFTVSVPVAEGPASFTATAADAAGNVSGVSNTVSVVVDRTAPAAPALAPMPAATRADTVLVSGTAEAGSTVELFVDGVSQGTAPGPGFSFALGGLASGSSYSVTAVATDAAGNASPASAPVTFLVDRTPPGLATVVTPADGAQLSCVDAPCGIVTFSGTAEADSSVEVEVDGAVLLTAADGAGTWTTTDALADGTHQVRARARDAAGNEGAWSALSGFTLDTTGPSAPVLAPLPSPTAATTVTVTGTAEAGVPVGIFLDGTFAGTVVASGAGAFSLDVAVTEGTVTFTAVARDALGNPSVPSNVVTVEVDHTAPAAPVLGAIASPSGVSTVVVTGTAEAGSEVEVFLDGALVGTVVATGGTFTLDVPVGPGSHSVTATATDPAGNVSPASGAEVFSVTVAAPVLAGAGGHVVGGGCGCGPGGGSPASALLLLGLALALAPRRRAGAASRGAAALLLLAAAGGARAQDASFAVDRFQLDPGAYGLLGVASARVPESLDVSLSLGLEGANGLLRLEREGSTTDLVGNVYAAQVGGAVALAGRYELGLVLPVAISRSTEGGPAAPPAAVTGVGDLKLVPKIVLPSAGGFRFAASLPFTVPTAKKDALLGEGGFTVNPTGVAETALGRFRLAGNLGVAVRPTRTYYDLEVGPAVTWGAGAELPFRAAGLAWTALAAAWGEIGLADSGAQATPAELDAGIRWQRSGLALTAGLGTGIVNGYGAPALRAFALAAWRPPAPRPAPAPAPTPIAKVEPPPPPDPCAPGQAHAPEQCPGLDDDGDAVANAQDRCPLVAGVAEEAGCPAKPPPPVVVAVKEEPPPPPAPPPPGPCDPGQAHAPEQCPELDDDGDGFANAKDRCPLAAGLEAHLGCPPPKAVLSLEKKKIEIKEAVFFETGKDRIEKRSHQLLEDIVRILEDHPEVKLVSIEGHTDSTGTPAKNQQLSERRASAVKIFLVTKGVDPGRLESRGFGQTRPIAKNETKDGKARNRRVEFLVK